MRSEGSAYLDRSGRVLVADSAFCALLGLPAGDASDALRERARHEPALARFVAGEGSDRISIGACGALPACELSRTCGADGVLVRATACVGPVGDVRQVREEAELAMQAIALARLAGSVAHEVKNPLNSMALQLALLGDKVTSANEALAAACAGNLASLRNQIGRINDVVRRYVEIADPTSGVSGFDAGGLLADAACLFGHEARRRQVSLVCDASAGVVRAAGDGVRPARWLLGLLSDAVVMTPRGGRLAAHATGAGAFAELSLEHPIGEEAPADGWVREVVEEGARDLGGALDRTYIQDRVHVVLRLPKEREP